MSPEERKREIKKEGAARSVRLVDQKLPSV